jgi:DNA-binding NtrC family response regulator
MTSSASPPTETILIVDDDPEVLSVGEDMLRAMGYVVISTADPRVALRLARLPGSIHLLLIGVVMPPMSGVQVAADFRAIRPEAKVLFMSGHSVEAVEAYRVELAPDEPFLKKPFTMDELQSSVTAALIYRPRPKR